MGYTYGGLPQSLYRKSGVWPAAHQGALTRRAVAHGRAAVAASIGQRTPPALPILTAARNGEQRRVYEGRKRQGGGGGVRGAVPGS